MPALIHRLRKSLAYPPIKGDAATIRSREALLVRLFALIAFFFAALVSPTLAAQPQPMTEQARAQPAQAQQSQAQQSQAQQSQTQQSQAQQPRPRIRLNTLKPVAGKNVVIVGSGLPAGSQVTARLTAPNGSLTQESTRVEDSGRFRLTLVLPNEGTYTLVVRGQGLDQTRMLEAQKAKPVPRPKATASPNQAPRTERPPPADDSGPAQRPPVPNAPAGSDSEK